MTKEAQHLFDFFYQNWLMYMDGLEHQFCRKRFLNFFPRGGDLMCRDLDINKALSRRETAFDLTEQFIRPYVIHMLEIAGITPELLQNADELINPVLQRLHGRRKKDQSMLSGSTLDKWSAQIDQLVQGHGI